MRPEFDRSKHVFKSIEFEEIIKDTVRFFNGTPVHTLPPPENFSGTGVYALYYTGNNALYARLHSLNRINFIQPIYVGKAVPLGWRQARTISNSTKSNELFRRLNEHANSVTQAYDLELSDFYCRFMILEDTAADLIGTVEAALIRYYKPVWNSCIDGFGNHDPGKGRYNQAKSDWDVLHKGRLWSEKCVGTSNSLGAIRAKCIEYLENNINDK